MYGNEKYGQRKYAEEIAGGSNYDEYYLDLFPLVPDFVTEPPQMNKLYEIMGYEAGYADHCKDSMIDQFFAGTATWLLGRWEAIFGIQTNLSLSYEERRRILQAKMRGSGTITKELMEEIVAAFIGGEVEVIEDNPNYTFTIRIIGIKGIPRNMQALIAMINEIKPAHLAYNFEYRYTVWDDVKTLTWDGLKEHTWDEVRVMEEV